LIAETRWIKAGDLARLLGLAEDEVTRYLPADLLDGLDYLSLDDAEAGAVRKRALRIVRDPKLTAAGPAMIGRWERGWGEILERVRRQGVSEASLAPQYFRHDVLRLGGRYIRANRTGFEPRLYAAMRAVLFADLFAGVDQVTEFGCGTGHNLLQLHRIFPNLRLTGCDWAAPSQELVGLIAASEDAQMIGVRFDMGILEGREDLQIGAGAGVMTVHALEQLGSRFEPFLDYLVAARPAVALHIEPIVELYDAADPFDAPAIAYHKKRGYLAGFLPALEARAAAGQIEILKSHRSGFGSTFHEAYSIVVWRAV
jgi:hypothetical protein